MLATNHITVTIDKVPALLKVLATTRAEKPTANDLLAVFMLSLPGIGKTDAVAQFAASIDAGLITMVASTLDRLDVAGLPITVHDPKLGPVTEFAPMKLMASLSKEKNPDGPRTILYFNELNSAPESVYPVLYRLFNERAIAGLTLRDNILLIADGNPSSAASAGRDMQMALRRRFAWLNIESSIDVWEKWALQNGVDARVVSFFRVDEFRQHFNNFDAKKRENLTYATPASWTKLAHKLEDILGLDEELRNVAYQSLVGVVAGTAFHAYMKHIDRLPDVDGILRDPEKAELPQKADILGLLVGSIVQRVMRDKKAIPAAIDVACRLLKKDENGGTHAYPEFGAFLIRSMTHAPSIRNVVMRSASVDKFIEAMQTHKELMRSCMSVDAMLKAMAA